MRLPFAITNRNSRPAIRPNNVTSAETEEVNMQASQVKEYFPSIKQRIDNAAQLCQITTGVPDNVRNRLGELDREADEAARIFEQERNENRIRQCVDRLEKLGDHVVNACSSVKLDEQVENAIQEAHDAISNLKHRLH
jgi:hypothetical protein